MAVHVVAAMLVVCADSMSSVTERWRVGHFFRTPSHPSLRLLKVAHVEHGAPFGGKHCIRSSDSLRIM
jgi:hypothetical protein